MSTTERAASSSSVSDPLGDAVSRLIGGLLMVAVSLLALPLLVPFAANAVVSDMVATKTRFWMVWRWQWLLNMLGILAVLTLLSIEAVVLTGWLRSGEAAVFFAGDWAPQLLPRFGGWAAGNLASGVLLLPAAWSQRRRKIAERVRTRRINNVLSQERIEAARKRAADSAAARRIGVKLDTNTGRIAGVTAKVLTVPHQVAGRQSFGFTNRATVRKMADRFHDIRTVRDWVDRHRVVERYGQDQPVEMLGQGPEVRGAARLLLAGAPE